MKDRPDTKKQLPGRLSCLNRDAGELRQTERRLQAADKALHYRILFEDLIMRISTELISLPTEKLTDGIDRALKAIAGFSGADRSYMLQLRENEGILKSTNEWHADHVGPPGEPFGSQPVDSYIWLAPQIRNGKTIRISRLADLPPEAGAVRDEMKRDGVRSLLLIPILYSGNLIGLVGFDAVHTERAWPDEIISLLRITCDLFANAIMRDRTERALEDLKRLDEMKDAFLSSVSHELRTPLTSIRSYSEVLLEYDSEEPELQREFLGIIKQESERLSRLIEDVLDLSRIQSGGMTWHDGEVCLGGVISHVAHVLQNQAEARSLLIKHDIGTELPPIFADKDRIEQVFQNLISNAIKFSREGGTIDIRADMFTGPRSGVEFSWVKVSVSDEGSGIEEADFDIIFDKFQQANHNTLVNKPPGTGLGLPICRDIITHYEGSIWVESTVGKGSTFFFTLPAMPIG